MRKSLVVSALAGAILAPTTSFAQTAAAAATPPYTLTGNLALVSDYRFRGLSQTFKLPAVQGGADFAHSSGIYLGTWASNVSGNQYPNGNSMEWDFYGGYKGSLPADFGYDVGLLYYWYPGAKFNNVTDTGTTKPNNLEIYAGVSWKWLSLKYSHTLTDFFGVKTATFANSCGIDSNGTAYTTANAPDGCFSADPGGSKGSGYWDLSATYPVTDKFSLLGHVGHQSVKNYGKLNYTDWKLGVTYDLNGWILGAAYVDTNARDSFYRATNSAQPSANVKEIGDATLVVSVSKTF